MTSFKLNQNTALQSLNTLGVAAQAKYFCEIQQRSDLPYLSSLPELKSSPTLVLGGGSNILFTQDYEGLVIRNCLRGQTIAEETQSQICLTVAAGETWHDLVSHCVQQGWGGIENLALIPGRVGAAPIQNIGAYGVELKDVFHSLTAMDLNSGEIHIFNSDDCQFSYRNSIFKQTQYQSLMVLDVTLRLQKQPNFNLSYPALANALAEIPESKLALKDIFDAVVAIRQSKLPNPAELRNAGSFFKNPIVSRDIYVDLAERFPKIPHFTVDTQSVKIPAAWMIEQCGWKGFREHNIGVYEKQPLVLVNYGEREGDKLLALAKRIQESVYSSFNIQLEPEVRIL